MGNMMFACIMTNKHRLDNTLGPCKKRSFLFFIIFIIFIFVGI